MNLLLRARRLIAERASNLVLFRLVLFVGLLAFFGIWQTMGNVPVAFAAPPSFDQCANGTAGNTTCTDGWINGNLGDNKAKYFEGDSVPQRITFTQLSPNTTYSITIGWDIINSGKHSYDYLTTYNRTVTGADACTGSGANCGIVNTLAIPDPGYLSACSVGQVPPQAYNGIYPPLANQVFTFFGDVTNPLSTGAYSITTCPTASGTVENTITITFNTGATGGTVVLAYAAHVATSGDWGSGNSAANISGSSYHNALKSCSVNISGCGQRDNQMATNAVTPAPGFATQVKLQSNDQNAPTPYNSIGQGVQFYDSATITGQAASGGLGGTVNGTIAFFLCGPTQFVTPCNTGGTAVPVQGSSTISVVPPAVGSFRTQAVSRNVNGVYCFRLEFTSSGTNYSNFTATATQGECVVVVTPTSANLASFKGVARAKNIKLKWRTATELQVVGFNVYRSTSSQGPFEQLNAQLIDAKMPGQIGGAKYKYLDTTALAGTKYFYRLELVGLGGSLEFSDIIKVKKPPAN